MGFPGPGNKHPMSENPFFELVGAAFYSHADQGSRVLSEFKSFCNKHGKQYMNNQEYSQRKVLFKHNYRYACVYVHFMYAHKLLCQGCLYCM